MTENTKIPSEISFDEEFDLTIQKKFLGLLVLDKTWSELSGLEAIKAEYFDDPVLYNICKWIHDYYKKYKDIPTKTILKEKAKEFVNNGGHSLQEFYWYTDALEQIYEIDGGESSLNYYRDKAVAFVRQQIWKKTLQNAGKVFSLTNYNTALEQFQQIMSIGCENDLGLDLGNITSDEILALIGDTYDKSNMVRTGIPSWDSALGGGFVRDNLHLIAACPGGGKEVSVNTPILTPDGWKLAKEIKIGDYLIGRNGKPTQVLGVYPQGISQNYKITFNDKSITNCGINHLWGVYDTGTRKSNELKTLSLKEILEKGLFKKCSEKRKISGRKPQVRWKIPLVEPVKFDKKEYIISPYNMGALLGDGHFGKESICLSCSEKSKPIIEKFIKELPESLKVVLHKQPENSCPQYTIQPKIRYSKNNIYKQEINRLKLKNTISRTKFIPKEYLLGSVEQRIDLLRGLMDTDGTSDKGCKISYATISKQLAKDVVELVQSLGGLAHINLKSRKPRESHKFKDETYYNVIINININPFTIEYKSKNWHETKYSRYITNVEQQEDVESVCFKVSAEDELFVMENYTVTHNSRMMAYLTKSALEDMKKVVFITLELNEAETMANILTSMTGLTLHDMLKPENRQQFEEKRAMFQNTYASDCVVKFYKPSTVTCDTIQNYIFKLIQHKKEVSGIDWKPDIIFLDYLDKLLPTQKVKGNMYEDIGGVADDCKNLAITFRCPVVSGSQLGRVSWNLNGDEVISMASISDSARKAHLAHSLTTINVNPGEKELGKARLFMAKSRSGQPGKTIFIEQNLGKCLMYETDPWDPKTLQGTTVYTIKGVNP